MVLEIEITRNDYAEYNKNHFFRSKSIKRIFIYLAALLALLIILQVRSVKDLIQIIIPAFFSVLAYIGLLYFLISRTGKIPKDDGSILGERKIEFTNEDIKLTTKDSESKTRWKSSMTLVDGKTALYLYTDSNMAIIIPKRYFGSKAEEEMCITFIEERIKAA